MMYGLNIKWVILSMNLKTRFTPLSRAYMEKQIKYMCTIKYQYKRKCTPIEFEFKPLHTQSLHAQS